MLPLPGCNDHGGDGGVKDHNYDVDNDADDVDDYGDTFAMTVMVMVMVMIFKVIRDAPQGQSCNLLIFFKQPLTPPPIPVNGTPLF